MNELRLSDGRLLSNYLAVGIAEGFEEAETERDTLLAWSFIGKNKLYLHLQGWFGRTLATLYDRGWFDEEFNLLEEQFDF